MPLFVADVPEVLVRTSACDAHEDVYLSKVVEPLLHHAIDLLVVTDVGQEREDFSAQFFALVRDLIELRLSFSRNKYQISAFAREGERDRLPIVAATAGYQRCLAFQLPHRSP